MDDHTLTGRVLAVLDGVVAVGGAATLAVLTRRTGIPKPTVRRIADDLTARGILERRDDGYWLGARLQELGSHAVAHQGLRRAATPCMLDLYARSGEIVWLSSFTATTHALIDAVFGRNRTVDVRCNPWPSMIHSGNFLTTAAGRILLSHRPVIAAELRSQRPPRLTPYTPTSWAGLDAAVRKVQDSGVAVEHEEAVRGYSCIAAGLQASDGRLLGAVGISARTGGVAVQRLAQPLLAAAAEISRTLPTRRAAHDKSR
jgi:DNA-binding IclR family transcriptional regulator